MAARAVTWSTCLNGVPGATGQVSLNRKSSSLQLQARSLYVGQSIVPQQVTSCRLGARRTRCFPLDIMRSVAINGGAGGLSCRDSGFAGTKIGAVESIVGVESRDGPCSKAGRRQVGGTGVQARSSETVGAAQRIIASLAYLLPLLDGIRYGRYLFQRYPITQLLVEPFVPLIKIYNSFPFAPFILFLILYVAIVQNPNFSRFVRFNTMQAVVLDVLLILPSLIERTLSIRSGFAFELLVVFYNTVFVYLFACFVYGVGNCILGKIPRLPLVAEAADNQVR